MAAAITMKSSCGGVLALPAQRKSVRVMAAKQGTADEIYLGFPKGDYDRSAGRKGRVVRDDPRKYPDREDLGFFKGAVGGWAGGEAALRQAVEQYSKDSSKQGPSSPPRYPSSPVRQPTKNRWNVRTSSSAGRDPIYVGFGKDELDLRKSGAQGRVIYDEGYKYPDRENMGFFQGIVGGFAGGEMAVGQFVETGELRLRKPGDPTIKKQFSPLLLAFLIIFAAAGGGVLLTSAFNITEF